MTTFRDGAEWMREKAAKVADERDPLSPSTAAAIRALPIPQPEAQGETPRGEGWRELRILAEGSSWRRDAGETIEAWAARTIRELTRELAAAKRGVVVPPEVLEAAQWYGDDAVFVSSKLDKIVKFVLDLATAPQQIAAPQEAPSAGIHSGEDLPDAGAAPELIALQTKSADRYGQRDVVPVELALDLSRQLAEARPSEAAVKIAKAMTNSKSRSEATRIFIQAGDRVCREILRLAGRKP